MTETSLNAVLGAGTCTDPNYPIYAEINNNPANYQCISKINKNFTFPGYKNDLPRTIYFITSGSCYANVTITWSDTLGNLNFEIKNGTISLYNSTQTFNAKESSIYLIPQAGNYTLVIKDAAAHPVQYTVHLEMNCLITQNIINCMSYNSNGDQCTLCSSSYPYTVNTNQVPLEGCANAFITKSNIDCYVYISSTLACNQFCNSTAKNAVQTNSFPAQVCITSPMKLTSCSIYNSGGTSCICTTASPHYVIMYQNSSEPCVVNLITNCVVYSSDGLSCLCDNTKPYYVLTSSYSQICIAQQIPNCYLYSSTGSTCVTCSTNYPILITTSVAPYQACVDSSQVITNCAYYNGDSTLCLCYNPYYVQTNTSPYYGCATSLISNCNIYTADMSQCDTCATNYLKVTRSGSLYTPSSPTGINCIFPIIANCATYDVTTLKCQS